MSFPLSLHDGWSVHAEGASADLAGVPSAVLAAGRVAATVPGCVHTDLLAAGLVDDPYLDDNENRLDWIGWTDWVYETRFEWSADGPPRVDLECAGLDTVATLTLNDVQVGETANMHRRYRFDVTESLRPGDNVLRVRFESANRYAAALRDRLGRRPGANTAPLNFIRKMACNFGWDWGPSLVTAGIWRPIALRAWSVARLVDVRPQVTVADGVGVVDVHVRLDRATDEPVVLAAAVGQARAQVPVRSGQRTATVRLRVEDPALWWPRGYGEPALYPLDVTLSDAAAQPLDSWSRRIGFRTAVLDTTPDEHGTPYTLVVNDVPVFVRGVNWIPDDCFPHRVDRDRYAARLTQAVDANVNYLRVWGGGCYESDEFYDVADELGLLVGQDFAFACSAYPEEEPIASEVAAEARDNVVRLASHPSLVTWTGNNECQWGYADWGWPARLDGRSWGARYYAETLPRVVAELDPTRPYWPGSPYSGSADRHPNEPAHGTTHIWDVWNTHDYLRYRSYVPRFVAEFGFQAPPTYATLRRSLTDEPLAPDSPGMRHHQKAKDGDKKLERGLRAHLPQPTNFDDWHWLAQLNQARAITVGIEHFRSLRPVCTGAIVWQLNDCWPVTSWAAIDGDARPKPLWYAMRRVFADRLLTLQPRDGGVALVAVNDSAEPWRAEATASRLTLDGRALATEPVTIEVAPRCAVTYRLDPTLWTPGDDRAELLLVDAGAAGRAWWFFAEDRDLAYPPADWTARVEPVADGVEVTVVAHTLLRDLTLFADRLDPAATVDEALVTLLPGESTVFTVRTGRTLDPAALTRRPVLRCASDVRGLPASA